MTLGEMFFRAVITLTAIDRLLILLAGVVIGLLLAGVPRVIAALADRRRAAAWNAHVDDASGLLGAEVIPFDRGVARVGDR